MTFHQAKENIGNGIENCQKHGIPDVALLEWENILMKRESKKTMSFFSLYYALHYNMHDINDYLIFYQHFGHLEKNFKLKVSQGNKFLPQKFPLKLNFS